MTPTVSAVPVRIEQLDVLRGFAVLGIFWVNIVVFGLPHGAYAYPTLFGTADELNLWTWAASEVFVEGTMRGLFSILFGASALIFLDEVRLGAGGVTVVERFYRRNLLLMAFGMIHAYFLLWPFDVLYAYGLLGLFLFPLRRVRARWLIVTGVALLMIGEIDLNLMEDSQSSAQSAYTTSEAEAGPKSPDGRSTDVKSMLETARQEMKQDINTARAGYWAVFRDRLPVAAGQQSTDMYHEHVFDIGGMMLIGMALLKLGILTGVRSTQLYILMVVFGYGFAVLLRGEGVYTALTQGFDAQLLKEVGDLNHDLGRLPGILGHIGMIALLWRLRLFTPVSRVLARVGRMALTNYVGQTVISLILFIGFDLYGVLERYQLGLLCIGVWGLQIAVSHIWLSCYRQGPLEWLWRSLIYGEAQPFRRGAAADMPPRP